MCFCSLLDGLGATSASLAVLVALPLVLGALPVRWHNRVGGGKRMAKGDSIPQELARIWFKTYEI